MVVAIDWVIPVAKGAAHIPLIVEEPAAAHHTRVPKNLALPPKGGLKVRAFFSAQYKPIDARVASLSPH